MKRPLTLLLITIYFASCTPKSEDPAPAPAADYCSGAGITVGTEESECSASQSYTSPAFITGTANFYKRGLAVSTVGMSVQKITLGAPIASALPIKNAEVRVINSSGTVIQCGKTDSSGAIKAFDGTSTLEIPNNAGTYTVQVLARANHTYAVGGGKPNFILNTSVKNPCSNSVHKIQADVVTTGAGTFNTNLVAYAKESQSANIEGGAFNIFNDIVTTYNYLSQNTANLDLTCLNPKLHVFWTAGFNPAQFIDPYSDPSTLGSISFYLRGYNELYINGGKLGNVAQADTDHFDDTVIIHELGHRIEDACGKMDSPGGTHYGQFRIDPRLAWSEGWGNFFGVHMFRNNVGSINPDVSATLAAYDGWLYYLDTDGYVDGTTTGDELIRINLSRAGNNPESLGSGLYYDKVDAATYPGEGHFREVSVSRSLFKSTNTCTAGTCTGLSYFDKIWEAFQNISSGIGMGKSIYPFRSSIRFYNRLKAVSASATLPAAISTMLNSDEAQQIDGSASYISGGYTTWVPYGIKLVSTGTTPCNLKIQPRSELFTTTYLKPDQRYSNHFYYFDRNTLATTTDIILTANKVAGTDTDIDLVMYQDSYTFPQENCLDTDCLSQSKNISSSEFVKADRSLASSGSSYVKQISGLSSLSFSIPYMLNVRAYTGNSQNILSTTEYTYTLRNQNGDYLCPSSTF